jgi:uncharacterized protein YndB with AHSA1/START domain
MSHHSRGVIQWRLHLPVAPEMVFEALDSEAGRAAFWAESAPERDGGIHFQFIDGQQYSARILQREPPHVWSIEYFGGTARFVLAPDGQGGTDLTLNFDGGEEAQWHQNYAGWLNVLYPLKAWVVFGVDLRNHDPARTWARGFIDQ